MGDKKVLYLLFFGSFFLFLMSYLSYRAWTTRKRTEMFYTSIIRLSSEARSNGLYPKDACINAIENKFPKSENVKTKMAAINHIRRDLDPLDILHGERQVVSHLLSVAAKIQSRLELERNIFKRDLILEQCLDELENDFDGKQSHSEKNPEHFSQENFA